MIPHPAVRWRLLPEDRASATVCWWFADPAVDHMDRSAHRGGPRGTHRACGFRDRSCSKSRGRVTGASPTRHGRTTGAQPAHNLSGVRVRCRPHRPRQSSRA